MSEHDDTQANLQDAVEFLAFLATRYETSEAEFRAEGADMLDYRPTYDRAYAAALRCAVRVIEGAGAGVAPAVAAISLSELT